ncbi:hypothetical protein FN846DRAFT_54704 [Sphaerosporella brunnea]|uniref:Uncharacterized protein n=1 Tax=Sphaerosporella brunnea TaxID=1250544 RepID=A0A5J5EUP4_9PEZI|nr:hypothetical protein FN846DRAFT_54704 [Sphaerosporella brunnea]
MSPIKSSAPRPSRPASTMTSSIPRRLRTTTATASTSTTTARKPKKPVTKTNKSAVVKDSILTDWTAANKPAKVTSYFSFNEDKENIPVVGRLTRSRVARLNARSQTRGKTGISKPGKQSPTTIGRSALARRPLRELTEDEVFERDEATLGDLRRRRSGEHSGTYVEFDTHTAGPLATVRESSIVSSSVTSNTRSQSTAAAGVETEDSEEKFTVLRRTDSEESLRKKVEAIMAATSAASSTGNKPNLRKRPQTKPKHPAVCDVAPPSTVSGTSTPDPYAISPSISPIKLSESPTKASPILARRSPAITKSLPSPVRTTRMGLGTKNANMILKEAELASKETVNGKKVIISSSNMDTAAPKKKAMAKKSVTSSLRRAAGSATATTAAKTGLAGLSRMR